MGGLIRGVSSAVQSRPRSITRHARYYNTDLAEYLIPVNADIDRAEPTAARKPERIIFVDALTPFTGPSDASTNRYPNSPCNKSDSSSSGNSQHRIYWEEYGSVNSK